MIGWMASDYFARSPVLLFPLIALALFFSAFVAVSLVVALRRKEHYRHIANLPLDNEDTVNHE